MTVKKKKISKTKKRSTSRTTGALTNSRTTGALTNTRTTGALTLDRTEGVLSVRTAKAKTSPEDKALGKAAPPESAESSRETDIKWQFLRSSLKNASDIWTEYECINYGKLTRRQVSQELETLFVKIQKQLKDLAK